MGTVHGGLSAVSTEPMAGSMPALIAHAAKKAAGGRKKMTEEVQQKKVPSCGEPQYSIRGDGEIPPHVGLELDGEYSPIKNMTLNPLYQPVIRDSYDTRHE